MRTTRYGWVAGLLALGMGAVFAQWSASGCGSATVSSALRKPPATATASPIPTPVFSPTPVCPVVLYIYVCPQFVSEGCCTTMYWRINGTCVGPFASPSGWINTGYLVQPNTTYTMPSNCPSCAATCTGTGCTGTASFTTPASFTNCRYCMPGFWQCTSGCTAAACP